MALKDKIVEDMKAALKKASAEADEKTRLATLRLLLSEIKNSEIAKGEDLEDQEILEIVQRQIKRRAEAAEQYEKGGGEDLAAKEKREGELLGEYRPPQLSDQELTKLISDALAETGAKQKSDVGKAMAVIMPRVKGRADGRRVKDMVFKMLD